MLNNRATEDIDKPEKNIINFTKAKSEFCPKLYYKNYESYLHVNKR